MLEASLAAAIAVPLVIVIVILVIVVAVLGVRGFKSSKSSSQNTHCQIIEMIKRGFQSFDNSRANLQSDLPKSGGTHPIPHYFSLVAAKKIRFTIMMGAPCQRAMPITIGLGQASSHAENSKN